LHAVETVEMMIPAVNENVCNLCGVCSDICEYHAIVVLPNGVLVFPELCHSCHGCLEICPQNAISEGVKEIGRVAVSRNGSMGLISGELKVGQPATTALIKNVKRKMDESADISIYDSPPGTSCPVIEAVKDVDYVVLVSEPTPFGLHDLALIAKTISHVRKPFGVVANKVMEGNHLIEDYCRQNEIPIIASIPQRRDIARAYARAELIVETVPDMRDLFEGVLKSVRTEAEKVTT
jgi:MinD superfamily P-loop ATPase